MAELHSHLYDACFRSNWTLVKQIVQDENERSLTVPYRHPRTGASPLHVAVARHAPLSVISSLVEHGGSDPNAVDGNGFSPLHSACEYRAAVETVRYLLSQGANPNLPGYRDGATPVHFAAQFRALPDVMQALLETGGEVNRKKYSGETPLFLAVQNQADPDLVRVLVRSGADAQVPITNIITRNTETPLSLAQKLEQTEGIKILQSREVSKPRLSRTAHKPTPSLDYSKQIEAARGLFRHAVTSNSLVTVREEQNEENVHERTISVRKGEKIKLLLGSLEEGLCAPDEAYVLVSASDGRVGKVRRAVLFDPASA